MRRVSETASRRIFPNDGHLTGGNFSIVRLNRTSLIAILPDRSGRPAQCATTVAGRFVFSRDSDFPRHKPAKFSHSERDSPLKNNASL